MPHIKTWDGLDVAPQADEELTGKAVEPAIDYRNQDIQQLYVFQGRGQNGPGVEVPSPYQSSASCEEGSAFEVNKEVVSIQDHNRFNPGPFQEGSAIFPGYGVIAEDHSAGSFRDSLTGEGRPTKIWTDGGASTFEDRHVGDYDANDAVFGVKENIDWPAANGGPGSSYLTAKNDSQSNAYVGEDSVLNWLVNGFMKLGDIRGELQTTDLRSDNRFVIECFEPAAGMNSFGESLNPVLEVGTNSGPGGSTFMTAQFEMPTDNLGTNSAPGGSSF